MYTKSKNQAKTNERAKDIINLFRFKSNLFLYILITSAVTFTQPPTSASLDILHAQEYVHGQDD